MHLLFLDFFADFLVFLRFSVNTHDPPRIVNLDLSVGTIEKSSSLNSGMKREPLSLVVRRSVFTIPLFRLRSGPAFLQLQLTQLYLCRLSVYSESGQRPVMSVEIFKYLLGLMKTLLQVRHGERSSSSLKVTVP